MTFCLALPHEDAEDYKRWFEQLQSIRYSQSSSRGEENVNQKWASWTDLESPIVNRTIATVSTPMIKIVWQNWVQLMFVHHFPRLAMWPPCNDVSIFWLRKCSIKLRWESGVFRCGILEHQVVGLVSIGVINDSFFHHNPLLVYSFFRGHCMRPALLIYHLWCIPSKFFAPINI